MTSRWLASDGLVERRAESSRVPSPTAVWVDSVQKNVEAALGANQREAQHGLALLYGAIRERAIELREAGWRVDQVLMAVKRDVAGCVATAVLPDRGGDTSRVPALLDAVVRWTVGVFYVGN
jgi:hypothetical protein